MYNFLLCGKYMEMKRLSKYEGVTRTVYIKLKQGKYSMNIRRKILPVRSVRLWSDTVVPINACNFLEGFKLDVMQYWKIIFLWQEFELRT